MGMKLDLSL